MANNLQLMMFAVILLLSTFFALATPTDTTTTRPIRIGIVGALVGDIGSMLQATIDGVTVAVHEANLRGGIAGRSVEMVVGNTNDDQTKVPVLIDGFMANSSTELDVLGFMPGRMHINEAVPALERHNLTLVVPVSGDRQDYEAFNSHLWLATPIPDAEVETLLRFLVLEKNLKRIAVLVTEGFPLGSDLLPYINRVLNGFGLNITYVFRIEVDGGSAGSSQIAEAASKGLRIQALINIGALYPSTASFLALFLMAFPDAYVGSVGLVVAVVQQMFSQVPFLLRSDRIFSSMFAPMYSDTHLEVIQHMRAVVPQAQHLLTNHPMVYEQVDIYGAFFAAGYVYSLMLLDVMGSIGANGVNKDSIKNVLFSKRVFSAFDWDSGPYSLDKCVGRGKKNYALCECNAGAKRASLVVITSPTQLVTVPSSTLEFSLDTCIQSNLIQSPLIQLVAQPYVDGREYEGAALRATRQFIEGDRAGYINATTSPSSRTGIIVNVNYSSLVELEAVEDDRLITVAVGGVYTQEIPTRVATNLSIILDPLYVIPQLYGGYSPRVVYLTTTLEQEIHTLCSLYGAGGIKVLTTHRSGMQKGLLRAFTLSMHTFGYTSIEATSSASLVEGLGAMAGGGSVFVHGIESSDDIRAIGGYLAAFPDSVVLLPFQHLSLWYEELSHTIADAHRSRLVFATSLPSWNPTSTSRTTLMQSFIIAVHDGKVPSTPRGLHGFLVQRLLANIVERIPSGLTQSTFLNTLFAVSVIVLEAGAFSVGPLSGASCGEQSASLLCEVNVGARRVEVRSLESSLANGTAVTSKRQGADEVLGVFSFSSGQIEYKPLPKGDGVNVLAVAVGVVVGVLAVILVAMSLIFLFCTGRSHRWAPKDQSKPFTLVFTDIQSSTNLWAEVPEEMGRALEVHHRLIRGLIKRHRGYEVKTIGDAFMIAFKSADDAIRMAFELQYEFFECDAFPTAIDMAYLAFDRERLLDAATMGLAANDPKLVNLSANLDANVYSRLWSGLRVRAGIHTSFGEIKKDEVTSSYDYYGTVANTAARVEAVCHGGQVCFTEGTLKALSTLHLELHEDCVPAGHAPNAAPSAALRLGSIELRGLVDHVTMYQLECVAGRLYPPLRLEESLLLIEDENGSQIEQTHDESESGNMSKSMVGHSLGVSTPMDRAGNLLPDDLHTAHVMLSISAMFSAVPSDKRARELRRFLDFWRVRVDRRAIEKAEQWGLRAPLAASQSGRAVPLVTSGTFESSTAMANAQSNGMSADELLKAFAYQLGKGDAFTAASFEGLARRLRPVGLRALKGVPLPRVGTTSMYPSEAIASLNINQVHDIAASRSPAGVQLLEFSAARMGASNNLPSPQCSGLNLCTANTPGRVEAQQ